MSIFSRPQIDDIFCYISQKIGFVKAYSLGKIRKMLSAEIVIQGPVVQNVVSSTNLLRVISLTVLAKATHIFSAKNFSIFVYHSM